MSKNYQRALKQKASRLWGMPVKKIKKVIEHDRGAHFEDTSGNENYHIPHEVWVLGWTEEEYIEWKNKGCPSYQ